MPVTCLVSSCNDYRFLTYTAYIALHIGYTIAMKRFSGYTLRGGDLVFQGMGAVVQDLISVLQPDSCICA